MEVSKLCSLIALVAFSIAATDVYIDKGACPGEGCTYGERWLAKRQVVLYARPSTRTKVVATLPQGTPVITITGEVHTRFARFIVNRAQGEFKPGDEILVYTYLGEGVFKVRHNGQLKEAKLGFSPWGGTAGTRCEASDRCWGTLESELQFDWWVLVRTGSGVEGWTNAHNHFENP